jgi:hypothetical protein
VVAALWVASSWLDCAREVWHAFDLLADISDLDEVDLSHPHGAVALPQRLLDHGVEAGAMETHMAEAAFNNVVDAINDGLAPLRGTRPDACAAPPQGDGRLGP